MREWLHMASDRMVVRQAVIIAAIVGTILVLLNHGPAILRGDVTPGRVAQMVLTIFVPYCVSTVSSVGAMRAAAKQRDKAGV